MTKKETKKDYYIHPDFKHVYGDNITTPIGRLCWAWLDKPQPIKEGFTGSPRYGVTVLLDKSSTETIQFIDSVQEMLKGMLLVYNKGNKTKLGELSAYQDGDDFDEATKEKYPFYVGHYLIQARNTELPQFKNSKTEIISGADIKGGMKGRLVVTPMITSKGASYKLHLVQIAKDDGVRFGNTGTRDYGSLVGAIDSDDEVTENLDAADSNALDSAIDSL